MNGSVTLEMKTEQVEDENFLFPILTKFYGILDVEVLDQNYHVEMDFDVVGGLHSLMSPSSIPINFKEEKRILKINGNPIPEEEISFYMQYILYFVLGDIF